MIAVATVTIGAMTGAMTDAMTGAMTDVGMTAGNLLKKLFSTEFPFPICPTILLGRYVPYLLAWVVFQLDIRDFALLFFQRFFGVLIFLMLDNASCQFYAFPSPGLV